MNAITIEALGITKEEAAERVIKNIADQLLFGEAHDGETGSTYETDSAFKREIDKAVRERINAEITRLGDEVIAPKITALIDGVTLQETNRWGEKAGNTLTFKEYLVQRAEAYMTEQVDYQGKSKGTDSFSWTGRSTRVAYMIDKHLHYQIERAMTEALGQFNGTLAKGLMEATRLSLNSALAGLKVEVKTK